MGLLVLAITKVVGTFNVALFVAPMGLCSDNVSKASVLLRRVAPSYLSLSLFLLVLGVPLFLIKLGGRNKLFAFCTVCAIKVCSLFT